MFTESTDLTDFPKRLAAMRRMYGQSIDLPNLGRSAFATLLGVSAIEYEACERGDQAPSPNLLAALYAKTGTGVG